MRINIVERGGGKENKKSWEKREVTGVKYSTDRVVLHFR